MSRLGGRIALVVLVLAALAAGAYALAESPAPAPSPPPPSSSSSPQRDAALRARAASAPRGAYVALGDSYSSGVGAGDYIASSGFCARSRRAYPYGLGRRPTSFRACGGARTSDVLRGQLAPFPHDTRLVTITIGGNDAGFSDVMQTCLLQPAASCDARVALAEQFVRDELPARLRRVFRAIRRRAARATVVAAGYPRLLARRPWCGRTGTIEDREQRRLNEAANLLVRTIAAEVRRHRGFRFADVRRAFDAHGVCSASPWILGVTRARLDSFHPTARGQAAYASAIRRRL